MKRLFPEWFLPPLSSKDFDPATEQAFQASLDQPRRQSVRTGATLSLALYLGLAMVDVVAIPGSLW